MPPLPHITGAYDRDLENLSRRVAAMGGLAERMVGDAAAALLSSDLSLAGSVIGQDEALDAAERALTEAAVHLIALRQPIAEDLREVVAAIRIAADLERIGDLAKNVAKRAELVGAGTQSPRLLRGVEALARETLNQLKEVLDAYVARDAAPLGAMRDRDGAIDGTFSSLFGELLAHMAADPAEISASVHLLFCLKNIERIGDHATAIAETVHLMVTGQAMAIERVRADITHSIA